MRLTNTRARARRMIVGFGVLVLVFTIIGIAASLHETPPSAAPSITVPSGFRLSYTVIRSSSYSTYVVLTPQEGFLHFKSLFGLLLDASSGVKPGDRIECDPQNVLIVPPHDQPPQTPQGSLTWMSSGDLLVNCRET